MSKSYSAYRAELALADTLAFDIYLLDFKTVVPTSGTLRKRFPVSRCSACVKQETSSFPWNICTHEPRIHFLFFKKKTLSSCGAMLYPILFCLLGGFNVLMTFFSKVFHTICSKGNLKSAARWGITEYCPICYEKIGEFRYCYSHYATRSLCPGFTYRCSVFPSNIHTCE